MIQIDDPTRTMVLSPCLLSKSYKPFEDLTEIVEVTFEIRPDIINFKFDEQEIYTNRHNNFSFSGIDLESILVRIDQSVYLTVGYKGRMYKNPIYDIPYYKSLYEVIDKHNYYKRLWEYQTIKEPQFEYYFHMEYLHNIGVIDKQEFEEVKKRYLKHKKQKEIIKTKLNYNKVVYEDYQKTIADFPKTNKITLCQRIKNYFTKQVKTYNEFI